MNSEPTVFIVDDDPAMLEFISVLVSSMGLKTKAYSSADAYLSDFDPAVPGCLILDVRMPTKGGLELQASLCRLPLCPAIIFMTGDAEVPTAVRAMQHGAVDFLEKPFSNSVLKEAIQRAIAKNAVDREQNARQVELTELFAQLSPAEHSVLQLVLRGELNKKIAANLDVSVRTVEDRRARLMQKLDVSSVAELIRLSIQAGFWKAEKSP